MPPLCGWAVQKCPLAAPDVLRHHQACQTNHGADSFVVARHELTAQWGKIAGDICAELTERSEAKMWELAERHKTATLELTKHYDTEILRLTERYEAEILRLTERYERYEA
eukprot:12157507-Alexandrium_andersonii.AAC.1